MGQLADIQNTRRIVDKSFREGRFYADEDKAFHFAFGKEKGAQAIKEFGGNPSLKTAYDHTQQQLKGWASVKPEEALAYWNALPEGGYKDSLMPALLQGWAIGDLEGAWRKYLALPIALRDKHWKTVAYESTQLKHCYGNREFLTLCTNAQPSFSSEVISQLVAFTAERFCISRTPEIIRDWISSQFGKSYFQDQHLQYALTKLASCDKLKTADTLGFLASIPNLLNQEATKAAMPKLMEKLIATDRAGLEKWLQNQPKSSGSDLMISEYTIGLLNAGDGAAAQQWALRIQDEKVKQVLIESLRKAPSHPEAGTP